jgi:hypothetical protein
MQSCVARIERSMYPEIFQTFVGKYQWSEEQVVKAMEKLTAYVKKPFLEYCDFAQTKLVRKLPNL